jgi:hypothetical protein
MKKRRKRKQRDVVMPPLKAAAIREFTRAAMAGYSGDDLWRVMQHIQARKAFAHEPPESVLVVFFKHVAVIVGKTYAERGEDAPLADDLALMLIRDLLLDLDAGIIDRRRNQKLPPRTLAASRKGGAEK